jgi:aminoglycoside phosphotransferase (APT) family kinase protein
MASAMHASSANTETLQRGLGRLAKGPLGRSAPVTNLERLSAGATQEIWAFSLGDERLVLRRNPLRAAQRLSGTDMATEAELIARAERQGVPVAPVLHVLTPEDELGQGFIGRFIAGETAGVRIVREPSLVRAGALARELGAILAKVHRTDINGIEGLNPASPQDVIADVRHRLTSDPTPRPVVTAAIRWLADHAPADTARSLVHGDYRIGNMIVDTSGVRAVLDWELARAGDPIADLAWFCLPPWRFGAPEKTAGGVGDEAGFIEAYVEAGGTPPSSEALKCWKMAGSVRWALFCAAGLARFANGEDRTPERALIARRASESEFDLVRLLEAA